MSIVKKIQIDGQMVAFKASAANPRIYRLKFQRDIYQVLPELIDGRPRTAVDRLTQRYVFREQKR